MHVKSPCATGILSEFKIDFTQGLGYRLIAEIDSDNVNWGAEDF